jgi:hypothetical protein
VTTASDDARRRRPLEVTVVMGLALVHAALLMAVGGLLVVARRDADVADALELSTSDLTVAGGVLVALGLAEALLAIGLGRGSDLVRSIFAIVATLQIAPSVYTLIALQDVRTGGLASLLVSLVVLWLLYGATRSQEFFAR